MNSPLECVADQFDRERFPDLARFQQIWEGYRGNRPMPGWNDFDFMDFPMEFIPRMFIVDVDRVANEFRYRFIGTKVVEMEGRDYTGRTVDDLEFGGGEASFKKQFEALVVDPKPTFFVIKAISQANVHRTLYAGLRLPLSSDGVTVDKILCMAHYDQDHDQDIHDYLHELLERHGARQNN